MSNTRKAALVILAAVIYFLITQWAGGAVPHVYTDKQLYEVYAADNARYFNNKLPSNPVIDWTEYDLRDAASTIFEASTGRFHIKLNEERTTSQRWAHLVLQHEMCHIESWDDPNNKDILGKIDDHGRAWAACQLRLEMDGAWRRILIDHYEGD